MARAGAQPPRRSLGSRVDRPHPGRRPPLEGPGRGGRRWGDRGSFHDRRNPGRGDGARFDAQLPTRQRRPLVRVRQRHLRRLRLSDPGRAGIPGPAASQGRPASDRRGAGRAARSGRRRLRRLAVHGRRLRRRDRADTGRPRAAPGLVRTTGHRGQGGGRRQRSRPRGRTHLLAGLAARPRCPQPPSSCSATWPTACVRQANLKRPRSWSPCSAWAWWSARGGRRWEPTSAACSC